MSWTGVGCAPIIRLMKHCSIRTALLLAIIGVIFFAQPLASEEENWQILLREQLLSELGCRLNYTTNVRKFELGGQQAIEARAHCYDKRMFDASWLPDKQKYEIRSCEPVVC